jgi:virulence-associated protein VagC
MDNEIFMKAEVSANGLTVPKRLLRGMHRVEIKRTQGMVVITPQPSSIDAEPDSLLGLGSNPAKQALKSGSRHHDAWIYRGK